jgi:hypothetical protein
MARAKKSFWNFAEIFVSLRSCSQPSNTFDRPPDAGNRRSVPVKKSLFFEILQIAAVCNAKGIWKIRAADLPENPI